jgi:hypothetical protein
MSRVIEESSSKQDRIGGKEMKFFRKMLNLLVLLGEGK